MCTYTVITSPEVQQDNKQCEEQFETKYNSKTFLEKPPTHTVSQLTICTYREAIYGIPHLSCTESGMSTMHPVITHLLWITNITNAEQLFCQAWNSWCKSGCLFSVSLQCVATRSSIRIALQNHNLTCQSCITGHREYVDYILVPFALGVDKRILTLILSRQGCISSAPCHQSSVPNVKVPLAGSLAYYIPSIMCVYLGETCQQCHHVFLYQKKCGFGIEQTVSHWGIAEKAHYVLTAFHFLQNHCLKCNSHNGIRSASPLVIMCHHVRISHCHISQRQKWVNSPEKQHFFCSQNDTSLLLYLDCFCLDTQASIN